MLESLRLHYIDPVRSFDRAARLFLVMIAIDGVIYSAWQLFFNFYMLQSGYTREFLGLVNSMPSAAGLIFGIPLGRLSDGIGRRASIILGIGLSSLFMLAQVTVRDPRLIAAAGFMNGASNMLFIISQAPLMAKLSNRDNRTMLFSLSFGLQTLSGAVGALFAGQLPGFFASALRVTQDSATAYQAVLITSLLLGTSAIVPMWLMREPGTLPEADRGLPSPTKDRGPAGATPRGAVSPSLFAITARMALPQIVIGFGAAILIPYMNVFFKDQFNIRDSLLGVLFSLSSLLIGIGSILAPRLSVVLGGKIRAIVFTQTSSLVFLLLMGFAPYLWLSSLGYLLRTALMNMASPLYSAFCMERTPQQHHGLVNSILSLSWSLGWAVGPFVSGVVQQHYGFKPLFVATAVLYGVASLLAWAFFSKLESMPELQTQPIVESPKFPE